MRGSSADSSLRAPGGLAKAATGIAGFDELTGGGLPRGRPTLICGGAGCGKTLFALEFAARGARDLGEPAVVMIFDETAEDLRQNVASLGLDLPGLEERGLLLVDPVRVRREEIEETGAYDLEGLFVRLEWAIERVGARRVVLDTVEALFAGLEDEGILRAELRRLFDWLKDRGMTAVVTGERGRGEGMTRNGLEEYISDCVLLLDHRVRDQVSTRRLRVVKYRGSAHGTNEYPFTIDEEGITVFPVTALGLSHRARDEHLSTGIASLDAMIGRGRGPFRGSSLLVTGDAGTGKTSLGATFVDAACRRGERCLVFLFEESASQLVRNMSSIGLDLAPWVDAGLLTLAASRPTTLGIEAHLARMLRQIERIRPEVVVIDPMSSLTGGGASEAAGAALLRLVDSLKGDGVTGLFLSLTRVGRDVLATELGVSSLMDLWIVLGAPGTGADRRRTLHVLKARGMPHAESPRDLRITDGGIEIGGAAGEGAA